MIKVLIVDCIGVIYVNNGVDQKLLDFLGNTKDIKIFLFTSLARDSVDNILSQTQQQCFSGIYTYSEIPVSKTDTESYRQLMSILNVSPSEAVFVDDSPLNLKAAEKIGITTINYTGLNKLKEQLGRLTDTNN